MSSTGTYASLGIKVQLQLAGEASPTDISGVTSFAGSMDANREEWVEFGENGWTSSLITSKGFTISLEAKYKANDDLHKKLMNIFVGGGASGHNGHKLIVTFPKGVPTNTIDPKLELTVNLSPSDIFGGDSNGISPLSIEMAVDGAPIYTEEAA